MLKPLNKQEMLKRLKTLEQEATMNQEDFIELLNKKFPDSPCNKIQDYYPIMVGWLTGGIQGIIKDAERM